MRDSPIATDDERAERKWFAVMAHHVRWCINDAGCELARSSPCNVL
jgi:hypothetical protein